MPFVVCGDCTLLLVVGMGSQSIVDQRIYQESSRDARVRGKREEADVPPQNYRDHVRKIAVP